MLLRSFNMGRPPLIAGSWIAFSALAASVLRYLVAGDIGLNLSDEGYLWNNVQRTFDGDVPIRDFRSYDPGRYYWGAIFFRIFGANFWALRLAESAFLGLGIWMGLAVLARAVGNRLALFGIGVLMVFVAFPMHKSFEIALIMFALLTIVRLLEMPTWPRHLQTGAAIGITAFFARNLAVYFLFGYSALALTLPQRAFLPFIRKQIAVVLGIIVGYSPMLFLLIACAGFPEAFGDSVLRLTNPSAPVKSIAVPWPWVAAFGQTGTLAGNLQFELGLAICGLILVYSLGVGATAGWPQARTPIISASLAIGIPAMHHILVRADFPHFTQAAFPAFAVLTGAMHLAGTLKKAALYRSLCATLVMLSAFLLIRVDTLGAVYRRVADPDGNNAATPYRIDGRTLWIPPEQAKQMRNVNTLIQASLQPGEAFFIAPFQPAYYLLHGKTAPTWDAFPIHRADLYEEQAMIEALESEKIRFALIENRPLDGRKGNEFSSTHPLVWKYLITRFRRIEASPQDADFSLFRR